MPEEARIVSSARRVLPCGAIVLLLLLSLPGCLDAGPRGPRIERPGTVSEEEIAAVNLPVTQFYDGWETSSLRAEAIEPALIAALVKAIRQGAYKGIDGVVLTRHGLLVSESYFGHYAHYALHQTRSSFKSVTGLLVGIAVSDGLLDLDAPVAPLIARYHQPAEADPRKERITVRHLLQMQSGLDCSEMPGTGPYRETESNQSPDKVAADFDLPMTEEPGRVWRYCSGSTFLLGVALESALAGVGGETLKRYLDGRLLAPLGIHHYKIGRTSQGHLPMHGGESMTPRDLAKFGQLLLDGGQWKGRQVVPAGWVGDILKPGVETDWSWTDALPKEAQARRFSRYQYKWFQTALRVGEKDYRLIHSWGNGGQFIFAVPDLDLVVVITGSNYGNAKIGAQKQAFHMLRNYILPAVIQGAGDDNRTL